MNRLAMAAVARAEWHRSRRRLLVLGVVCGIVGGVALSALVVERRSTSAPDRLVASVRPGDAHVQVFDPLLLDDVLAFAQVRNVWVGSVAVARLEGRDAVQYAGVLAMPADDSGLVRPVVVAGRTAAEIDEATITEDGARRSGLGVGDRITLALLTAEEIRQFDTGFGEPDGGTHEVEIVGIVRVLPGMFDGTPLLVTAASAAEHPESYAGADLYIELRDHTADEFAEFAAAVRALAASAVSPGAVEPDFAAVSVEPVRSGIDALVESARVLVIALRTMLAVAIAAALLVSVQTWRRHHAAGIAAQWTESALGLPRRERTLARVWPAFAAAAVASVVGALLGAASAWIEPIGTLHATEPEPGPRVDPVALVGGSLAIGAATVAIVAACAWQAGAGVRLSGRGHRSRVPRGLPGRGGWPLTGTAFALSSGRVAPVRGSLIAAIVGVAGATAGVSFTASLDRLVAEPVRWGWTADASVADIDDADLARLRSDPDIDAVTALSSGEIVLGGRSAPAYGYDDRPGSIGWTVLSGRMPRTAGEVVLGTRLARDVDLTVGDRVAVGNVTLTVVGTGLGPVLNGERLGASALLTPKGLARATRTLPFREALIRVAPDADRDAVLARYAADLELVPRVAPAAVRDVAALDRLPDVIGLVLALAAVVMTAQSLVVTARDRSTSFAVMRALGATARQTSLTLVAMATVTALVGVVVGVPLGLAAARLLWGEVAHSIGVRGGLAVPSSVALVVLGALALANACALVPALRVGRDDPAQQLRSE